MTLRQRMEEKRLDTVMDAGRRLGYEMRPRQQEVVLTFLKGKDVFVSLPTGSGKSLCYWILPWTFDKIKGHLNPSSMIVVISPLISLVRDQVNSLTKKGLSAIYVGDVCDDNTISRVHEGHYQVIFFSPELILRNETWRDMITSSVYRDNLVGLVVDEAHCVKKW